MKKILLILLLCFNSCYEYDKSYVISYNDELQNLEPDYLGIATNILAPSIGEWSTNNSTITFVESWTLTNFTNHYMVTATVIDLNGNYSSWAISEFFATPNEGNKLTCWCGTIGGSPTSRGKCVAKSDFTCAKQSQDPCLNDCNPQIESTNNWSTLYGNFGLSILSSFNLPTLEVLFN